VLTSPLDAPIRDLGPYVNKTSLTVPSLTYLNQEKKHHARHHVSGGSDQRRATRLIWPCASDAYLAILLLIIEKKTHRKPPSTMHLTQCAAHSGTGSLPTMQMLSLINMQVP
jgi:hypothetical protein